MSLESLENSVKALQQLLIEENKRKNEFEREIRALRLQMENLEAFVKKKLGEGPAPVVIHEEETDEVNSDEERLLEIDFSSKKFVKEGPLKKKSELRNAWKDRWFRLYSQGPLFYFEDEKDTEPAGVIYLTGARLFPHTQKNGVMDPLMFSIRYGKMTFLLAAHNMDSKNEWIEVLKDNITGVALADDATPDKPMGSIFQANPNKAKKKEKSGQKLEAEGESPKKKKRTSSSKRRTDEVELEEMEQEEEKPKSPKSPKKKKSALLPENAEDE